MLFEILKKFPVKFYFLKKVYVLFVNLVSPFSSSSEYWDSRYLKGGNSGSGSYSKFAEFKSEVVNDFIESNRVDSVVEFGSGDGNQLKLMNYKSYVGFDVSETAVEVCRQIFNNDLTKRFALTSEYAGEKADLSVSLDVIYHLVEDSVFEEYMSRLFSSAERFVIIYSSNTEECIDEVSLPHVKHRRFSNWVEQNCPEWVVASYVPNKYPYLAGDDGSFADFYIYMR